MPAENPLNNVLMVVNDIKLLKINENLKKMQVTNNPREFLSPF
jgi:hypothetical protein